MAAPFAYQSLDTAPSSRQIRLLKLLPAKFVTDAIVCNIFHASLAREQKDQIQFEALSYVWGNEENPSNIILAYDSATNAERSPTTPLKAETEMDNSAGRLKDVTRNLEDALRHIRLTDFAKMIWVDALCINQKDLDEKSHQVKQMRNIYLNASKVLVWLGEERNAKGALEFLRGWPLDEYGEYIYVSKQEDEPKWEACYDLFTRPWWSRTWILQEVLHNRDVAVYLGNFQTSLEDLLDCFNAYYHIRLRLINIGSTIPRDQQLSLGTVGIDTHKTLLYSSWFRTADSSEWVPDMIARVRSQYKDSSFQSPRLGGILIRFRDQKATDPKDKIYAFLGMVKAEYSIPIDYKLRKGDIYTITTRQLLARILLVLLWVESSQREVKADPELPSWVPDFTHSQQLIPRLLQSTYDYFNADKNFPGGLKLVDPSTTKDCRVFAVSGLYVGRITGTHSVHVTKKWSDDPKYKDGDLLMLIRYDRNLALRQSMPTQASWPSSTTKPEVTFENTSWGPSKCEIGDIIIIAAGCRIPLVLRKCGLNYLFVGGCWLIDSQIEDFTQISKAMLTHAPDKDSGFSLMMFGSLVEEIGKSCEVEDFDLC